MKSQSGTKMEAQSGTNMEAQRVPKWHTYLHTYMPACMYTYIHTISSPLRLPWWGMHHGCNVFPDNWHRQDASSWQESGLFWSCKQQGTRPVHVQAVQNAHCPQYPYLIMLLSISYACLSIESDWFATLEAGGKDLKATQVYPGTLGLLVWHPVVAMFFWICVERNQS